MSNREGLEEQRRRAVRSAGVRRLLMRKLLLLIVPLAGAAALGGCAEDKYGAYPYGYGYGGVGYSAAWGDPYWGWYGDYYYPGTGIYIYDVQRHRRPWTDDQRHYWEGRRQGWHGPNGSVRTNWRGFRNRNR
jgi:hypothetical protein